MMERSIIIMLRDEVEYFFFIYRNDIVFLYEFIFVVMFVMFGYYIF